MTAKNEAGRIYHDYFGGGPSSPGEQRMEDAWLQFPECRSGGGDLVNATDFIVAGIVEHVGERDDWSEIEAELRPMVEAGLRA